MFLVTPLKEKRPPILSTPSEDAEHLISLVNESYKVAMRMKDNVLSDIHDLLTQEWRIEELVAIWKKLLLELKDTEAVWDSVLKVFDEEKTCSPNKFPPAREELLHECTQERQIIIINIHWVEIYEKECIAALAVEKAVTQSNHRPNFYNKPEAEKQYKLGLEALWVDATTKLLNAQAAWKRLILIIPFPEQQSIWNEHFSFARQYPDLFFYWSHWWKTAVKCRFDTKLETIQIQNNQKSNHNPLLVKKRSSFLWNFAAVVSTGIEECNDLPSSPSSPGMNSNRNSLNRSGSFFRQNSSNSIEDQRKNHLQSLDHLSELKKSEENIWDELITTSQTIRKICPTEKTNHLWIILLQEIEFQKCYTLIEKSLITSEFLKSQMNSIAEYPLVKYSKHQVEQKRPDKTNPNVLVTDTVEKLLVEAANLRLIKELCQYWEEYKEELKLEEELCDNAVNISEALLLENPELENDYYQLLLPSNYFQLCIFKWKINYIQRLIEEEDRNEKRIRNEQSDATLEKEHQQQEESRDENEKSEKDTETRHSNPELLRAQELCLKLIGKYANLNSSFQMWKPETFEVVKLNFREYRLNSGFHDIDPQPYEASPMKHFLKMIYCYKEMVIYKSHLEEMLFGVPDLLQNKYTEYLDRSKQLQSTIDGLLDGKSLNNSSLDVKTVEKEDEKDGLLH
jgi:hypothetical protein